MFDRSIPTVVCSVAIVAVVMGRLTVRSKVVSGEIDKCPPDLRGGEPEEFAGGGWPDLSQRFVEPHAGSLKNVISLLPTPEMWIITQHLSRQVEQAISRFSNQVAIRGFITFASPVEERLQLCRVPLSFGHVLPIVGN